MWATTIFRKKLLQYCWNISFSFFVCTPEMLFCNVLFRVWSQSFPKTVVKDFTNPKFLVFAISKIICKPLSMRKRCGLLLLGKAHKCQTRNSTWSDKITKKCKRHIHVQKRKDVRNKKQKYVIRIIVQINAYFIL